MYYFKSNKIIISFEIKITQWFASNCNIIITNKNKRDWIHIKYETLNLIVKLKWLKDTNAVEGMR